MARHGMPEYSATVAVADASKRHRCSCAIHPSVFCCLHYLRVSNQRRESHRGVVDLDPFLAACCGTHAPHSQSLRTSDLRFVFNQVVLPAAVVKHQTMPTPVCMFCSNYRTVCTVYRVPFPRHYVEGVCHE